MREKGGSRSTLCGEKHAQIAHLLGDDEAAAPGGEETLAPLRRHALQQRCGIARRRAPRPSACSSMSVAKIVTRGGARSVSMCSRSRMAIE